MMRVAVDSEATCPPAPPPPDRYELMRIKIEAEWRQKRAGLLMLLDDDSAIMTRREFDDLDNYSCTIPSGTFVGKIWKRGEPYRDPSQWFLGEYTSHEDPDTIGIKWRRIYIID